MRRPPTHHSWDLAAITTEADNLLAANPNPLEMRGAVCVIRGYVGLWESYEAGAFPWKYVRQRLGQMRKFARDYRRTVVLKAA